jgi:hypothetical protein
MVSTSSLLDDLGRDFRVKAKPLRRSRREPDTAATAKGCRYEEGEGGVGDEALRTGPGRCMIAVPLGHLWARVTSSRPGSVRAARSGRSAHLAAVTTAPSKLTVRMVARL